MSPPERDRLQVAVADAERRTSAEVILAIAEVSDDYRIYPLLWSAAVGFVIAGVIAFILPEIPVRRAFGAIGAAVLLLLLIMHWAPLHILLVPGTVQHRAATALAQLEFAERVAGRTKDANGLLIFIAVRERYVTIIPDHGIGTVVPEAAWQTIVADLVHDIREGRMAAGIIAAIGACGVILAEACPPGARNANEIDDAVALIDPAGRPQAP